jgi:hypothetical protein
MDFFTVPTLAFGVLYCFFVIAHDRRRNPPLQRDQASEQCLGYSAVARLPYDSAPGYLIFDRDASFNEEVIDTVKSFGIRPKRTSFRSPWQNGVAERWVGNCRRDLLDHVIFTRLKFSPNTVILRLASLRFFFIHVLKRGWSIAETPYPKKVRHLPGVLSQEEVARLIDAADTPFHRILLMTLYATGARRAEAAHLKVSDIDSQRPCFLHRASAIEEQWLPNFNACAFRPQRIDVACGTHSGRSANLPRLQPEHLLENAAGPAPASG